MGWLLDTIDAGKIVSTGIAMTAAALLLAGRANSFGTFAAAHIMMGLGMALAAMIPAALVVSNWFDTARGIALGIAMAGMSLGGSVLASVVSYLITRHGWRWSYSALAGPLLVLVLPMVLLTIRTQPGKTGTAARDKRQVDAEGLTTGEAMLSRSFWLLAFVYFSYLSAVNVGVVHMVPYLIGLRFSARKAALIFSIALFCSTLGKPVMGALADRLTARRALALAVLSLSCGFLLLTQAAHPPAIWPLVVLYGIGVGAPVALVPMMAAESFGLKHFGTLAGLIGCFRYARKRHRTDGSGANLRRDRAVYPRLSLVCGPAGCGGDGALRMYRPSFKTHVAVPLLSPKVMPASIEASRLNGPGNWKRWVASCRRGSMPRVMTPFHLKWLCYRLLVVEWLTLCAMRLPCRPSNIQRGFQ